MARPTNGVLYHIATHSWNHAQGGKRPYRNPHESGEVVATMSSKTSNQTADEKRLVEHTHAVD